MTLIHMHGCNAQDNTSMKQSIVLCTMGGDDLIRLLLQSFKTIAFSLQHVGLTVQGWPETLIRTMHIHNELGRHKPKQMRYNETGPCAQMC